MRLYGIRSEYSHHEAMELKSYRNANVLKPHESAIYLILFRVFFFFFHSPTIHHHIPRAICEWRKSIGLACNLFQILAFNAKLNASTNNVKWIYCVRFIFAYVRWNWNCSSIGSSNSLQQKYQENKTTEYNTRSKRSVIVFFFVT